MKIDITINEDTKEKLKNIEKVENISILKIAEETIKKCFEEEKIHKCTQVNISIVSDETIKEINRETRDTDKVTDVLSFPMYEKEEIESANCDIYIKMPYPVCLGDIVLNIFQIERQAKEFETGFKREFAYMLVHSFYHLMGEDHMVEEEKKIMRKKEENIMIKLGKDYEKK